MKIAIFVLFVCLLLPVQPEEIDHYTYCETCLTVAQELEKSIKEAPVKSRNTVVKRLISGALCEKPLPHSHHVSKDKLTSACRHLLESHRGQFYEALVNKEPKNLDIALCYEHSNSCVGVKRQTFEDSKGAFTESDIDALLRDNKENVRIAQPIHSGSPVHTGDEL
ncbi:uncharacterized protein LOC143418513 [Maylandia zebra]|uniref:uncharacterized protein LOC143418513 n=1 Tax=Maylandia zebra TaxID=106582 RepID=UPI00403C52F9